MYSNLMAEMARRGMHVPSLSKATGICKSTIYDKLRGRSSFTLDQALVIRDALNIDMDLRELFRKEEE